MEGLLPASLCPPTTSPSCTGGVVNCGGGAATTSSFDDHGDEKGGRRQEERHRGREAAPPPSSPYRKVLTTATATDCGDRKIGYAICEASNPSDRRTAVLWFYPLSGHSLVVESAADSFLNAMRYRATVLCVDRPGFGDTDPLSAASVSESASNPTNSNDNNDGDGGDNYSGSGSALRRIQGHADDVLRVLRHYEEIERVYLVGVCIGHVYAVQVARRLLKVQQTQRKGQGDGSGGGGGGRAAAESTEQRYRLPKLEGMALVAPFVSTECEYSWGVARLGSRVPRFVLSAATSMGTALGNALMPSVLTPKRVRKLVKESEQRDFGWEDPKDYEVLVETVLRMNRLVSHSAKAVEANLGADPSWQRLCDQFAVESGYGLVLDDDNNKDGKERSGGTRKNEKQSSSLSPPLPAKVPLTIYACRNDKVSPLKAVRWLTRRCYGGGGDGPSHRIEGNDDSDDEQPLTNLKIDERIHSHEIMTTMGGPPRNPVLLHEIVRRWGLLPE